jgi:hypothetical protein
MKKTNLIGLVAAPLMVFALSLPALAAGLYAARPPARMARPPPPAAGAHAAVTAACKRPPRPRRQPLRRHPGGKSRDRRTRGGGGISGAGSTCKDGTTSTATGRGACSGHGGVQKAAKTGAAATAARTCGGLRRPLPRQPRRCRRSAMAPAAAKSATVSKSAPTATASNTDPTGATAKCKDGTYSKSKHHSGTCSSHGGVAEWLTAQ